MKPASPSRSESPTGFLSREEAEALFKRCTALVSGGGEISVTIDSWWAGGVEWARNRAHLAKDVHQTLIGVSRRHRMTTGLASTTQLDDAGLRDVIRRAERAMHFDVNHMKYDTRPWREVQQPMLNPELWSEATYQFNGQHRGDTVRRLIEPAEAAGLVSAGELKVQARSNSIWSTEGVARYYPSTRVIFSTTVRDSKGTGSGWAGVDDFNVTRLDMPAMAQRALEKCKAARNPVAFEPGRYTAILEPQAVADLWAPIMVVPLMLDRPLAEADPAEPVPFTNGDGYSKITERVLDTRLTVSADPMDPEGGFLPFQWFSGAPFAPATWIDRGVLRQLAYDQGYAITKLGRDTGLPNSQSWRMSGGTTSIDEMIATTKRGILVTRLYGVEVFDNRSVTCSGYTRNGLWLIEDGKISKPIKNFRFTESPLFSLNRVEQVGVSRRVYSETGMTAGSDCAWIAPALKVRDFNFTQLADAV